ncbi:MAG: PHP domain-containing protein [Candidatus Aminicenantes bacterium]|nr:PHP domain-containing protein [Candidatus Aminicenantes bacterium]
MGSCVDLHIHSNKSSDGTYPPCDIVEMARKIGLKALSIADHDTVAAYPEALICGKDAEIEVIPNMEVTTIFKEREFHMLLPLLDWENRHVKALESRIKKRRMTEARERVDKLQQLGFAITWEDALKASAPFVPLGVTIAQVVIEKERGAGRSALKKSAVLSNKFFDPYIFYQNYFMEGKPAWVPRRNIDILDVLRIVPRTGGVPVLAHPGAFFQRANEEDIAALKDHGLQGIEVYSSYHDKHQIQFYKRLAEKFDLVITAGSDFHGEIKPHIAFGSVENGDYAMVEELRKRRDRCS